MQDRLFVAIDKQSWKTNVTKVPTIRTYIRYKDEYLTETYAYKVYYRGHRSIMAQFKSGILPLSIEIGRYTYIPQGLRLFIFCQENCVENEEHFLFHCSFYSQMRYKLVQKAINFHNHFLHLETDEQFRILMDDNLVKDTADILYSAYCKGHNALYK